MTQCQCGSCDVVQHASGCAVHNAPALPVGACDCSTYRTDPFERLAAIKAFVNSPDRMKIWDDWRRYIAAGGTGSLPRDGFESMLDWISETCDGN